MLDKHYRLPILLTNINAANPAYFGDHAQLNNKIITGITIDIASDVPPLVPDYSNFALNDKTVVGDPKVTTVNSLGILYVTFVNDNDEILIENAPANLFSNLNSNYPQPRTNNTKKRIIPTNLQINFRKSYIKKAIGFFPTGNIVASFNFYYK